MGVLDAEYQRMYDLKIRFRAVSQKQINEHTDITASYEQHKKGGQSQDFHSSLNRRKTGTETPKTAILAILSKNP